MSERRVGREPDWLSVRRTLLERRRELTDVALTFYPNYERVAGTALLACPRWQPDESLQLEDVVLALEPVPPKPGADGRGVEAASVRGVDPAGNVYTSYAESLGALARPAVYDNRWIYRLLDAELTGSTPRLRFCQGRYFDTLDVGEAAGHELARACLLDGREVSADKLPLRTAVGDPCALHRRPAAMATSTLTIRHDRDRQQATCVLHRRDPAKVTHAGGLHQVIPVGVFQPSRDDPERERRDFDIWLGTMREYAEEFLGAAEDDERSADYESAPLYRRLTETRSAGGLRVFCVGMGFDPLTLTVDLLTVAIFDAEAFDSAFSAMVDRNEEGEIVKNVPFTAEALEPYLSGARPRQAAGAAVIALALRHRDVLVP